MKIAGEFDHLPTHPDMSINRCAESLEEEKEFFTLTCFKLGNPTPNAINECSGIHYLIEEHLQALLPTCNKVKEYLDVEIPPACSQSTSIAEMTEISMHDVTNNQDIAVNLKQRKSFGFVEQQCEADSKENKNILLDNLQHTIATMCYNNEITAEPYCKTRNIVEDQQEMKYLCLIHGRVLVTFNKIGLHKWKHINHIW